MKHRIRSAGILIQNQSILMVRVKDFSGEYWIPPGGGMEKGDRSSKDGLKREFLEETGLEVEVGELICVREFLETHTECYHAEFFYQITAFSGEPHTDNLVGLNDEQYIQSVEWIAINELDGKRVYPADLKSKVIGMVEQKNFSTHLGSYVQGEDEKTNYL
ncbi:NUDIX domain-containing protein [Vibrio paucivorans]